MSETGRPSKADLLKAIAAVKSLPTEQAAQAQPVKPTEVKPAVVTPMPADLLKALQTETPAQADQAVVPDVFQGVKGKA